MTRSFTSTDRLFSNSATQSRAGLVTNYWFWPIALTLAAVAVVLIVFLEGLVAARDNEELRGQLTNDLLWLEQHLRFELRSAKENYEHFAADYGSETHANPLSFAALARSEMKKTPELEEMRLLDARGVQTLRVVADGLVDAHPFGETIYKGSNVSGFSAPAQGQNVGDSDARLNLLIPVFDAGVRRGSVVLTFNLKRFLNEHVPWWFLQRYWISLNRQSGEQLATLRVAASVFALPTSSALLNFSGLSLSIEAGPYQTLASGLRNFLVGLVASLLVLMAVLLLLLRRDVRRRRKAELQLRNADAFRYSMEDSLQTGLAARDLEGRLIYVNKALCAMTNFSFEELVGIAPPLPFWLEEAATNVTRDDMAEEVGVAPHAPISGAEYRFQKKGGEIFDCLVFEAPLIDGHGQHIGWMGSFLDITERKRNENLLRVEQEKMQFTSRIMTMGEMASTVAHELNQPLSAIMSYNAGCLNLLKRNSESNPQLIRALEKLAEQAQRAGKIVGRIHDFMKRREPQRAACDLRQVIENVMELAEADAQRRGVRINVSIADNLQQVFADHAMLEQVLLNLIRNAIDALQPLVQQGLRSPVVEVSASHSAEGNCLRVVDHGPGIEGEKLAHVFDPFWSTKDQGMGMGLAICRSIIEFHHGRLWVEPTPGGGASFIFVLPDWVPPV